VKLRCAVRCNRATAPRGRAAAGYRRSATAVGEDAGSERIPWSCQLVPFQAQKLGPPRRLRTRCVRTEHGNRLQGLVYSDSRADAPRGYVVATNETAQRLTSHACKATLRRRSLSLPCAAGAAASRS
jgi:hypothetical protein